MSFVVAAVAETLIPFLAAIIAGGDDFMLLEEMVSADSEVFVLGGRESVGFELLDEILADDSPV